MDLLLNRKNPANIPQITITLVSQSPCKASSSSSDTDKNSFHLKKQPANTKPIKTGENTPYARELVKQSGADWTWVFNDLKNAIKIRHYSSATLRTYSSWTRGIQAFTKSKDPNLLDTNVVKAFLTWLAVGQGVSAFSQNQAFNALLFFVPTCVWQRVR